MVGNHHFQPFINGWPLGFQVGLFFPSTKKGEISSPVNDQTLHLCSSSGNPNDPWIIQGINRATKGIYPKNSKGYNKYKGLSIEQIHDFEVGIRKNHNTLQENSYFCNWFLDFTSDTRGTFGDFTSSTIPTKTIPFLSVAPTTWLPILGEPPCISVSKGIT